MPIYFYKCQICSYRFSLVDVDRSRGKYVNCLRCGSKYVEKLSQRGKK